MGSENAVDFGLAALALMMLYPVIFIIGGIIIFYLIYNRIKEKKKETFEKRSN